MTNVRNTTTGLERLEAVQACRDLVERYTIAVNDGDVDDFVALFAPDAVWQRPHVPALRGQDAIREFMSNRPGQRTIRHVTGGIIVEVESPDRAGVRSQTLEFTGPAVEYLPVAATGLSRMVEYRDRVARFGRSWLFTERVTTVVFAAPPR